MKGLTVSFIVALGVAWAVTPLVLHLALRKGALAVPRDRDVHRVPTPRWGGIAIYLGVVLAVLITVTARHFITGGQSGWTWHLVGILLAGTMIAAVGVLDDVKDLRALFQALGIVASGVVLISFGVRIEGLTVPFLHTSGIWQGVNLPFWVSVVSFSRIALPSTCVVLISIVMYYFIVLPSCQLALACCCFAGAAAV